MTSSATRPTQVNSPHLHLALKTYYWSVRTQLAKWQRRNHDPFRVSAHKFPAPKTFLDIGANLGQFAKQVLYDFPGASVYSFEPIPECYKDLAALQKQYQHLSPIPLALGEIDGEAQLWLSRFRGSSSFHEMLPLHVEVWPQSEMEGKIGVKIARLDTIAPELKLRDPVFAKLDVQGHELKVIEGGCKTLARCQRIMVECNFAPLYKDQPSPAELNRALHSLGFELEGFISPLLHLQTRELLSADALYYRP